jgi:hypothetical protein
MTMRIQFSVAVAAAVWASSGAFAAEMRVECPVSIPESSIKPDKPVAGWVTVVPGQMLLRGAGMMAGRPETKTYLVPDKTTKTIQTFVFARGEERWMFCDYGAVELSRNVGDGVTTCTITTKATKPELFISAVAQCR